MYFLPSSKKNPKKENVLPKWGILNKKSYYAIINFKAITSLQKYILVVYLQ